MIQIELLYEFAKRHALMPDPVYSKQRAVIVVDLSSTGRLIKATREEVELLAPRVNEIRSINVAPRLLDNWTYTFGAHTQAFQEYLEEVGKAAKSEALTAVLKFVKKGVSQDLLALTPEGSDTIAFRVDEEWPYNQPSIKAHYRKVHKSVSWPGVCRLTGGPLHPDLSMTHTKVRNLPGGSRPSALISFNKPTSLFEGLEQGYNYPLSGEVVDGYTAALSYLLEYTDNRSHRSAVDVGNTAGTVFWAISGLDMTPVLNVFNPKVSVDDPKDKTQWAKAYKDLSEETQVQLQEWSALTETVYCLTLKAFEGRIAILDWCVIPANQLAKNLLQFLEETGHRSVYRMIDDLGRGKNKHCNIDVVRSVLTGAPWPKPLQDRILNNNPTPSWVRTITQRNMEDRKNEDKDNKKSATHEAYKNNPIYLLGYATALALELQAKTHGGTAPLARNIRTLCQAPGRGWHRVVIAAKDAETKLHQEDSGKEEKPLWTWVVSEFQYTLSQLGVIPQRLIGPDQGIFLMGYEYGTFRVRSRRNDTQKEENQKKLGAPKDPLQTNGASAA